MKRPDVAERMKKRIGVLNPMFGKKNPALSERNKKRLGPLNPMYGIRRKGFLNPMFGKKHPNFSEQMKKYHGLIGELNPHWKGGKIKATRGYILIYKPDHRRANKQGYVFEHILVAEKKYARPIRKHERIHHIDLIHSNNDPDNLTLFNNQGDHTNYHKRLKQYFD